jgi:hypothetical protein
LAKTAKPPLPVSGNNPCPFLRALVASGRLADGTEPIGKVAEVIVEASLRGEGRPALQRAAIAGIALIANGLSPAALLKTRLQGLQLNALRGGPLDKRGVGSGILDAHGKVDAEQLARLREFAIEQTAADGSREMGLGLPQLKSFMDANFERAAGHRRRIDRALMNGEWPVLLKVMGKQGPKGRYLSLHDVDTLFNKRRLPERMMAPP